MGRVGNQGSDLDLCAQLYNSYEHTFPGFRFAGKKKRVRARRRPNQPAEGPVPEDPEPQAEESGPSAEEQDDERYVTMWMTPSRGPTGPMGIDVDIDIDGGVGIGIGIDRSRA